ncbi:hypothetical protein EAI_06755 [Harpegnathos saltator]|uniref:Uncharacterized protein n=1 Tax=Harpegnathos saltator TaxID=610380 RepID=E2BK09_HARSA|nr:hypothetical protein EAI_06755 [Harpegnathos saltator]
MIGRLYELLTEDAKYALLDDLADLDAFTFDTPTLHWLAAKVRGSRPEQSMYKFDDLPKAFSDLQEHPTIRNWKYLVLMSIAVACTCMLPRVKIKLCQYLRRSVENLARCEDSDVSALTKLFSRLLKNENPWVRQETLKPFERIGNACSKQLVVKLAKGLAKIPTVSNITQAYLSCTPHYVLEEREEKIPRLEKENSQNIAPVLIQLAKEAEKMYGLIEALEGQANVSKTVCRKLITVLEKILNTSK